MAYRSIFGQDLTDYEIDVIVDNGLAASEWALISRRAEAYQARFGPNRVISFIAKLLKGAGVAAGAVSVLTQSALRKKGDEAPGGLRGVKRATIPDDSSDDQPESKKQKETLGHGIKRKRDHIENESNKQLRSLPNLRREQLSMVLSGDGGGSGNETGLTETPIDSVTNVERGPPNYTFASLPFYFDRLCDRTQWSDQWTFRMTSPYDCSVSTTIQDQNVGAGAEDAAMTTADPDGTNQAARWFSFYSGMYKYYHVVSCRWHLMVENLSTEPVWVHTYYHNQDDLPVAGSNADMFFWQGVKSHYLGAEAVAVHANGLIETSHMNGNEDNDEDAATAGATVNYEANNNVTSRGPSHILTLSGEYRPGDYKNAIHLDSSVENWTAVTTNPALSERFSFRIKPQWDSQALAAGDANTRERRLFYRYTWKAEYLVEFKELVDGLKYPVRNQPITVTVSQLAGTP